MNISILKRAIHVAKKNNDCYRFRHAAILFDNNDNIISEGWNISHPIFDKATLYGYPFKTLHAELMCFLRARRKTLVDLDILIIRINKSGVLLNSRPCECCTTLLEKYDINRIYYSLDNDEIVIKARCIGGPIKYVKLGKL